MSHWERMLTKCCLLWSRNDTESIMNEHIIELSGVTVRKAKGVLLDGISLNVARNEFVGIIGSSGAGKTTLLNVS